ncbi:MAG: carboxypeptidase-like regulatory domain-containing protein [Acidobacteriota bacterium]
MLVLLAIVTSVGCSSSTTPRPTPTPTPTPTPSPAVFTVTGSVSDAVYRPVANVRIQVVSGPQQGTVTISDEAGKFAIEPKLSAASQIRASKQGYVDSIQFVVGTGQTVDLKFFLASANAPLDWSGTYDVTLTADATCAELPELARRRTYTASVTMAGVSSRVVFSGARFGSSDGFDWNIMPFKQFEDYVDLYADDPPIVELLPDNAYYMVYGGASGTVTREFAQLNLSGGISYCPSLGVGRFIPCDVPLITCVSRGHQMTMTRR